MTRALVAVLAVAVGSCMPTGEPGAPPAPLDITLSVAPHIRVALAGGATRPALEAAGGVRVVEPVSGDVREVDGPVEVRLSGRTVEAAGLRGDSLVVVARDPAGAVAFGGRQYAGVVEVHPGRDGVLVVNRLTVEDYLVGVVRAEMGERPAREASALMAQAVASRTYALRLMERTGEARYDMLASEAHQVYVGRTDGDNGAAEAVRATRGEVLTWNGELIEAFYSSTCGGRAEAGRDVFVGGNLPYLRAEPDLDPSGRAWCAISPRYQWRERWDAGEVVATLRRTLAAEGLSTGPASDLRAVRVTGRTGSGRVAELELVGGNGRTTVSGSAIRRVLATPAGGALRSTDFTIRLDRRGGRLVAMEAEGRGFGHGVGMCQWGAIGRARAGQDYRTILTGYFPGTRIERRY